jgi:hypothetical protein
MCMTMLRLLLMLMALLKLISCTVATIKLPTSAYAHGHLPTVINNSECSSSCNIDLHDNHGDRNIDDGDGNVPVLTAAQ